MLVNPSSFTYENLSSLKFKELQKLSVQFHVNKRWAKKQELIENLLALKDNNAYNKDTTTNDEEKQWKDGSLVFKDLTSVEHNESVVDKRLTFNVDKKNNKNSVDPRLTFEISQNGKQLLNQDEVCDSRQTYEVPQKKIDHGLEPVTDSRGTFDIPQKGSLIADEVDPRATFEIPQTGKKLLKDGGNENNKKNKSGSVVKGEKTNLSLIDDAKLKQKSEKKPTFGIVVKDKEQKSGDKIQPQVKMLTIPYARVSTRRTRKDGDGLKTENSPIKISKKSINIKKSSRLPMSKIELIKSPGPMMRPIIKPTIPQSSVKSQITKPTSSKIPTKVPITQEKSDQQTNIPKTEDNDKENKKKILRKKKSATEDGVIFVKKQNVKISFMTPPSVMKTHRANMPLKKTPMRGDILMKGTPGRLNSTASHTPKANTSVTKKSVTATKMPDFNKIHKKQFEQMDSLQDYLRKKEERRRKLFGTPQNGSQLKAVNKSSTGLFHFQSSTCEKSKEISSNNRTPLKKRETNVKIGQKDAFKSKLPPSAMLTDIKDKNRSHIHGVRTNKRFELQMKFRNM